MRQHFTLGAGPAQIMGQHVLPRLYGCRRLWVWVDPTSRKRLRSQWLTADGWRSSTDACRSSGDRDICCSSRAYVICHCHWCMSIPVSVLSHSSTNSCASRARLTFIPAKQPVMIYTDGRGISQVTDWLQSANSFVFGPKLFHQWHVLTFGTVVCSFTWMVDYYPSLAS